MDEPPIVSNYTRAEPPTRVSNKLWWICPAVILPICMGMFVTGFNVFFEPAAALHLPVDKFSVYQKDLVQTVATLTCVICGIVISTRRTTELLQALAVYFGGFMFWGTAYLMTFGQAGVNSRNIMEPIMLSGMFGMGSLVVIVGPGILVLWMFVWMFRTASEPARRKTKEETVDPIKHAASMESMIEARQQVNTADQGSSIQAKS